MLYIVPSNLFNAMENTLPSGSSFGFVSKQGWNIHDSATVAYYPFNINVTTQTAVGMTYNELIQACEPLSNYHLKIYRYIENVEDPFEKLEVPKGHDYKAGLTTRLHLKRTTARGEVIKVDYYSDPELTDLVLTVDINYTRDAVGFATERQTTRRWVMENGNYNTDTKVTQKSYTDNPEDQIKEGIRRRQNIIDTVQPAILGAMIEVLGSTLSQLQILLLGRQFIDEFESQFDRFVKASSTVTDPADPNFGRKNIVVAFEAKAQEPEAAWMNTPSQLLGGATVLQFLVNEFSI
jgi:hypothetical protein